MKKCFEFDCKKTFAFYEKCCNFAPAKVLETLWSNFRGEQETAAAVAIFTETLNARMAELVDALVSGTSVGYDVQVRVLFRAHIYCAGGEIGIHATLRG